MMQYIWLVYKYSGIPCTWYFCFTVYTFNMLGFVQNMKNCLFRGSILVSKLLRQGYYSRKLTDIVRKFETSVSHILIYVGWRVVHQLRHMNGFLLLWVYRDGWVGAIYGAGNAHSFRNTWFHSIWKLMISPIHTFVSLGLMGLWLRTKRLWVVCLDWSDCFVSDLFI